MKTPKPLLYLWACLFVAATIMVYRYREENLELRSKLQQYSKQATKTSKTDEGSGEVKEEKSFGYSAQLEKENKVLKDILDKLSRELAEIHESKSAAEKKLDEVIKPTREDILSSTLKTFVGKDEVIVTAGYQTADGKYQFTMVEPVSEELSDGRTVITLKTRQYSIQPDTMAELGLDSLSTNARHVLQHGRFGRRRS